MSRRCPCRSRVCEIVVPTPLTIGEDGEPVSVFPPAEKVRALRPHIGTIADLAADYDRCAENGELTHAVDFATWLQITAGAWEEAA